MRSLIAHVCNSIFWLWQTAGGRRLHQKINFRSEHLRKIQTATTVSTALIFGSAANADSVDFITFATEGQNFQNTTLGAMTLSSSNGSLVCTGSYGGGLFVGLGGASDIIATFSTAVSSISVRAGDGGGDNDAFGLIA